MCILRFFHKFLFIVLASGFLGQSLSCAQDIESEDYSLTEEDIYAYKVIIDYLTIIRTKKPHEWTKIQLGLSSALASGADVSIILLRRSTTQVSAKALAYLSLLEMDGALSEDRTCAILDKGESILPHLNLLKNMSISDSCIMPEIDGNYSSELCHTHDYASSNINRLIHAIENHSKCDE